MMKRCSSLVPLLITMIWACAADGSGVPSTPMPEVTGELLSQGSVIYIKRCSYCHGLQGDGNGPAADFLDPRPRDFTLGIFKFRTTQSGELPTDEDLFRTVSLGLTGTAMQAFDDEIIKNGLSEAERWAVIAYIKTFAIEFSDPEFDPVKNDKVVSLPSKRPPYNEESIRKGEAVFERAKCWECHGKSGRGDGQKSFDRTDDWGFPIRIRNLTHPWRIKAGTNVEDIYMRFSTGILGTPMPSFVDALTEEERWYLANYIKSLQHKRTDSQVLKALEVGGDVPVDPFDPRWDEAKPIDIRLAGQVIGAPRWQNNSIDLVTARAVFDGEKIAFLVTWDDPFKDTVHDPSRALDTSALKQAGGYSSYVRANGQVPRELETFRDSIALQFPSRSTDAVKKPHFFRGSASDPVNLWIWQSDRQETQANGAIEAVGRGWKQDYKVQGDESQQVWSDAVWAEGRWQVVFTRALATEDRNDVQFERGKFIPLAVNAWDGSNGEHGLLMSLSSWYFVVLEDAIAISAYVYALIGGALVALLGIYLRKLAITT